MLFLRGLNYILTEMRKYTYRVGSRRECPICEFSGRAFLPMGSPPRKESQCPECGARERHRLLWYYIEEETNMTEGDHNVLYIAPNDMLMSKIREYGNNVVSTDLMMSNVDTKADITCLPFKDDKFDVIICSHVLEHVTNDRSAISEIKRVMSLSGYALIMVPKDKNLDQTYEDNSVTSPQERRSKFGAENHVRLYGKDFDQRLIDGGFKVNTETYANKLDNSTINVHGLKMYKTNDKNTSWLIPQSEEMKYEDIHYCVAG